MIVNPVETPVGWSALCVAGKAVRTAGPAWSSASIATSGMLQTGMTMTGFKLKPDSYGISAVALGRMAADGADLVPNSEASPDLPLRRLMGDVGKRLKAVPERVERLLKRVSTLRSDVKQEVDSLQELTKDVELNYTDCLILFGGKMWAIDILLRASTGVMERLLSYLEGMEEYLQEWYDVTLFKANDGST